MVLNITNPFQKRLPLVVGLFLFLFVALLAPSALSAQTITLNGLAYDIDNPLGEEYVDSGGVLRDADGTVLDWSLVTVVSNVDTSQSGSYQITYSYPGATTRTRYVGVNPAPTANDPPVIYALNPQQVVEGDPINVSYECFGGSGGTRTEVTAISPTGNLPAGSTASFYVQCWDSDDVEAIPLIVSIQIVARVVAPPASPAPPLPVDTTANNEGIVPCGDGRVMCTLCDIVALAQRIMNFFVFLVVIVAALLFVNAGVLYLFSPASPANIAKAHRLFINTLIGIIIVLASFLLIDFAMKTLYGSDENPGFAFVEWGPWNDILCKDIEIAGPPRPVAPAPGPGVVAGPAPGTLDTSSFVSLRAMGLPVANWEGINGPGRTDLLRPDAANAIRQVYNANLAQNPTLPFHITSAYTEGVGHSARSMHYQGHAVDFQPVDQSERTPENLARLAQLARDAGFTYVLIEARHVHADMR